MGIKKYKPVTAGRRNSNVDDFKDLTTDHPEKSLTVALRRKGGRNNQGKITVRHQGGGHKRRYRIIDAKRAQFDKSAEVLTIEYDPNRSSRIALIKHEDGKKSYIVAPDKLAVGEKIMSSKQKIEVKLGNRLPLKHIPAGMMVYDLELQPGEGAKIVRSAGSAATIMSQEERFTTVKMPSTEVRNFSNDCLATIGQVSNQDYRNVRWGKAGRSRWRGIRPTVRGKVMNPVDHPHGGGEGNQPIGLKNPKTPSGKPALGVKTRKPHKLSDKFIVQRRKK